MIGTLPDASWTRNSEPVAMKHDAMAKEDSFERASREGATGVWGGVKGEKLHQNLHPISDIKSLQDSLRAEGLSKDTLENAAKDVLCRLVALNGISASCPTRT